MLKGIAAAQFLWMLPGKVLAAASNAGAGLLRRVRPSDTAWPKEAEWKRLADEVGSNLIQVQPLVAAADFAKNLGNPFFLGDQPGGTQVSGWLDAWSPAPSAYAVRARQTSHVVAAVNFARQHNLRLVVKGAGHSYQGTSSAPDSLLVWMRSMNEVTIHDAFVPKGGEGQPGLPAVSAGAGAVWIDLYHAVTSKNGRYVQGGGCTDVGVAGLVQSGGFGSMSRGFGTAAANLLEAEIVTADGRARTVNAHSDPDLFWAIQGGGGGSWGVVTRVTLRTHDLPEYFGSAYGTIKAVSDDAFRRLLTRFFDFYASDLFGPNWGEEIAISSDNSLKISMVSQGLDTERAKAQWQPFFDWVTAAGSDYSLVKRPGAISFRARGWWDIEGNAGMIPDKRAGAPKHHGWWKGDQDQVGAFIHGYDSLWLPANLLSSAERPRLVAALFASSRHQVVHLQFNKGLAGAAEAAVTATRRTATNPAACEAFALAIIANGEGPAYPGQTRPPIDRAVANRVAQQVALAAAELRKVAPNAGSYVSESNYFNEGWQQAFWGDNYSRLQRVKAKYDPDGLFFVRHGVGTENWSQDGFTRVT